MISRVLFFFFLMIQTTFAFSQLDSKQIIAESMNRQEEAWNRGDIEGFMQAYWNSDSLLFIGGSGPQYGWSTTVENYKKSYPNEEKMGKLSFELISFNEINEKNVHLSGKWQLIRTNDTLKGHYSLLWREIKGEWKIIFDHSSSIKN